jgi:hypothetical protein
VISSTLQFPLIRLGVHFDKDNSVALWENGARVFESDLLGLSDLMSMSTSNAIFLNISSINSPSLLMTSNKTSSVMFCQAPIASSFCIDFASLTLSMSKVKESFMQEKLQSTTATQMISTYSCINFCSNNNAQV